ncbi:ribosomal RNA small subunit methyltransferase A [Patescibacteria group bacterium]|nr:ribosomal RNA small subunit methyltransferase A [Patescibacteria group bacterium]MBU4512323.1 ribosomal RNA small subunit methyltransferase A [Patescibacteria group bacterium]MCG2693312.1 16S rRNA (adenine(1518)-N(6)/adenine(1519)-N(6))-dimethyltransferase RsmA [Candidatus Parcubacteria bacterium]
MNLADTNIVRSLCKKHHIKPSRQHGQNFLIDNDAVQTIIKAADLQPEDVVLEVGPGFGAITKELAKNAGKVLAVEIDKKFVSILNQAFAERHNVKIVKDDILRMDLFDLEIKDLEYKIVSNLPYNITSHFIRQRLTQSPRPKQLVLVVQKEVAERICAKAGEMSLLSVSVQFYAQPVLTKIVPRTSFWPKPEVDAAIVKIGKIGKHRDNLVGKDFDEKRFFQIVRIGFSSRRKMLKNNLATGLKVSNDKIEQMLEKAGLDKKIRAQDLGMEHWIRLVKLI